MKQLLPLVVGYEIACVRWNKERHFAKKKKKCPVGGVHARHKPLQRRERTPEIFYTLIYFFDFFPDNVPPTILFGLPRGSAAIEPSGALAVFPGSILHLECLFARRMGNPEWTWTSTFRQYLTGTSPPEAVKWKFAKTKHSGNCISTLNIFRKTS